MVQLIFIGNMAFETYKDLLLILQKQNALQLQIICIMIIAVLRGLVFNTNALLFGMTNIIACLNESSSLILRVEGSTKSKALKVLAHTYFLFLFGSFPFFIRLFEGVDFLRVFSFIFNNMQEISISILMFTLLTTVHISFEDINNKITSLLHTYYPKINMTLESIMLQHLKACELLDNLSLGFGFNIALQCLYNLTRIVFYSYYSYFMLVTRFKVNIEHIITATEVPYRFFAIWYLGRKCDQIAYQVKYYILLLF